jgi:glutathione S-transferase
MSASARSGADGSTAVRARHRSGYARVPKRNAGACPVSTHLPALAVLLTVLLAIWTMVLVGRARQRHGIKAPATTGNPEFERVFRVQMNTLESTVAFLPCLWLAARYWDPAWAGALGLAWVAGRVWYAIGYMQAAGRRDGGYLVSSLALFALLGGAGWGLARALLGY